jgi:hypothetical protein
MTFIFILFSGCSSCELKVKQVSGVPILRALIEAHWKNSIRLNELPAARELSHFESTKSVTGDDTLTEIFPFGEVDETDKFELKDEFDETKDAESVEMEIKKEVEEFESGVCAIWQKVDQEIHDLRENLG